MGLGGLCTAVSGIVTAAMLIAILGVGTLRASTYVVMIPMNSSIYNELDTLDGLGYLDTYLPEIRPISRVEAARLTLEAERNMRLENKFEPLAVALTKALDEQLSEEIGWLESNREDNLPTMAHPLQSADAQYIYSTGPTRHWLTGPNGVINAQEGTPLLPYDDGLQTDSGSDEIMRMSGWAGFGSFLTGYAQGAVAGPITHDIPGTSRGQLLSTEAVASLGDTAISFGQGERSWGTGYFAPLSQSTNAKPFWGVTAQGIHPSYLPWILRYLGPGRREVFMGQLDADRASSQHPWIVGHVLVFKPVPYLEFGITRTIIFGGRNNDHYNSAGFLGRFTGIATGSPVQGQTKSRGGVFFKFHIPKLRGLQVYQEIVGSDNLAFEIPTIGHYLPFLSVAYQGGFYLPRLTEDGLTDLRFEYALIPGAYSIQSGKSLYFTYDNQLFGDAIGPNASQVDVQIGRWFGLRYKVSMDMFYTEQAPNLKEGDSHFFFPPDSQYYPYAPLGKEHSGGVAFDVLRLAEVVRGSSMSTTIDGKGRLALEYVHGMNYGGPDSFRALVSVSIGIAPGWKSLELQ